MILINETYIQPQLKVFFVETHGVLCQSNGAQYDPTQEVTGITWDED